MPIGPAQGPVIDFPEFHATGFPAIPHRSPRSPTRASDPGRDCPHRDPAGRFDPSHTLRGLDTRPSRGGLRVADRRDGRSAHRSIRPFVVPRDRGHAPCLIDPSALPLPADDRDGSLTSVGARVEDDPERWVTSARASVHRSGTTPYRVARFPTSASPRSARSTARRTPRPCRRPPARPSWWPRRRPARPSPPRNRHPRPTPRWRPRWWRRSRRTESSAPPRARQRQSPDRRLAPPHPPRTLRCGRSPARSPRRARCFPESTGRRFGKPNDPVGGRSDPRPPRTRCVTTTAPARIGGLLTAPAVPTRPADRPSRPAERRGPVVRSPASRPRRPGRARRSEGRLRHAPGGTLTRSAPPNGERVSHDRRTIA
ncbi:hypothetical protein EDD40_7115 [Saccharothrix texasensis]|uniref:Uncharacterized protein n=1 Tax=Saccharothrix texasensis TaxID=103734 RepID=A0A3N1HGM9_9PSEU|nr:hypothetical protein EDD40_7115 [Saccharothrix texasensis]